MSRKTKSKGGVPNSDIRILYMAFFRMGYNLDSALFEFIEFKDSVEKKNELADKALGAIMQKHGVEKIDGEYDYSKHLKSSLIETEVNALMADTQEIKPLYFLTKKQIQKLAAGNPGLTAFTWKVVDKYVAVQEQK